MIIFQFIKKRMNIFIYFFLIVFIVIEGEKILFHLNSIDLNEFKKNIKDLMKKHNLYSQNNKNVFNGIIQKIESIKSYGIKGKRRIYVGYNKERKVQNRLEKVIKRGSYFYAKDSNFSNEVNQVPDEYVNKIICGDSEKILKNLLRNKQG